MLWRQVLGWFALTPVELLIALVLAATLFGSALPRYEAWKLRELLEEENADVARLNFALGDSGGTSVRCPEQLDDCPPGATAATCSLFSFLAAEYAVSGRWQKGQGYYRGPAGGDYVYVRAECRLVRTGSPVAATDQVPQKRSGA